MNINALNEKLEKKAAAYLKSVVAPYIKAFKDPAMKATKIVSSGPGKDALIKYKDPNLLDRILRVLGKEIELVKDGDLIKFKDGAFGRNVARAGGLAALINDLSNKEPESEQVTKTAGLYSKTLKDIIYKVLPMSIAHKTPKSKQDIMNFITQSKKVMNNDKAFDNSKWNDFLDSLNIKVKYDKKLGDIFKNVEANSKDPFYNDLFRKLRDHIGLENFPRQK